MQYSTPSPAIVTPCNSSSGKHPSILVYTTRYSLFALIMWNTTDPLYNVKITVPHFHIITERVVHADRVSKSIQYN